MKFTCSFVLLFVLLFASTGCGNLKKAGLDEVEDATPVSSVSADETYAQKISEQVPLHLYFGSSDGNSLSMEVRYIPMKEAKKSVSDLASSILRELLAGPTGIGGVRTVIPAGTRLAGNPIYQKGMITVNLSNEFAQSIQRDPVQEKLAVFSIVNSLTEVKEIDRVQFLIEGKLKKDHLGKLKLDAIFPRNPSLIHIPTRQSNQEPSKETSLEITEVLD